MVDVAGASGLYIELRKFNLTQHEHLEAQQGLSPCRFEVPKDHRYRPKVYKARINRKLLRFLAPSLIRIFGLLVLSFGFGFWGFNYLSSPGPQSLTGGNVILDPPTIWARSTSSGVNTVITKAILSPYALSFDLGITAPRNSKKLIQLTICIYGDVSDLAWRDGWNSSSACSAQRTIGVPNGFSTEHFQLSLTSCLCYAYMAPYLLATGLGGGYEGSGVRIPVLFPITELPIQQDVLDLSNAYDLGSGVFFLSANSYPPTQQVRSAAWQWQDIEPPKSTYFPGGSLYFVAESVSGKDDVDSRTFKAGLLLGVAGSGIIVVLDHLFEIWREIREYRDQASEKKKGGPALGRRG